MDPWEAMGLPPGIIPTAVPVSGSCNSAVLVPGTSYGCTGGLPYGSALAVVSNASCPPVDHTIGVVQGNPNGVNSELQILQQAHGALKIEHEALKNTYANAQKEFERFRDFVVSMLTQVPPEFHPGTWDMGNEWWGCNCCYQHKAKIPSCAICCNCRPSVPR